MKTVKGNVLDKLDELVEAALRGYKECKDDIEIETDSDTFMFILEDIGNEEAMSEEEFKIYSEAAYKKFEE